ncbi:hypothetical protein GCM10009077_24170 [Roseibium denhamense]
MCPRSRHEVGRIRFGLIPGIRGAVSESLLGAAKRERAYPRRSLLRCTPERFYLHPAAVRVGA